MELVSTIEISGEEREIADAYARQQIEGISSNLVDQKMLGWSVPKECPIQNYVDSDGVFHQRVGRLDLGSLKYTVQTNYNRIITAVTIDSIKSVISTKLPNVYTDYCRTETSSNAWSHKETIDRCLVIESKTPTDVSIYSPPSDLSELKGHYLYYELATPITMTIDGNEAVTKIKNDLCKRVDYSTVDIFTAIKQYDETATQEIPIQFVVQTQTIMYLVNGFKHGSYSSYLAHSYENGYIYHVRSYNGVWSYNQLAYMS